VDYFFLNPFVSCFLDMFFDGCEDGVGYDLKNEGF
jgi:hypothetical protein